MTQRKVQALLIFDPRTNKTYGYNQGDGNGEDESAEERPTSIVVCSNQPTTTSTSNMSLSTPVEFYYNVETSTPNVTNTTLDADFTSYISGEMVELVALDLCTNGVPSSSSSDNNNATNSSSTLCVLSVSSGTPDTIVGKCKPSTNESESCYLYEGSLQVTHSTECSTKDVQNQSIEILEKGMTSNGPIVENNNKRSEEHRNGILLTNVDLINGTSSSNEVTSKSATQELDPIILFLLILLGLILLCTGCLVYGYFRRRAEIERLRREKLERRRNRNGGNDDDSVNTDWSNFSGNAGWNNRGDERNKPDFHDLGKTHNGMDVHVCKSAMCPLCAKYKDVGKVTMIPVSKYTLDGGVLEEVVLRRKKGKKSKAASSYGRLASTAPRSDDDELKTNTKFADVINDLSLLEENVKQSKQRQQLQDEDQLQAETLVPDDEKNYDDNFNDKNQKNDNNNGEEEEAVQYVKKSRWDWARGGGNMNNNTHRQEGSDDLSRTMSL